MKSLENIACEALLLPVDQRIRLASRILASVEPTTGSDVDRAWQQEIQKRIQEYDAGITHTLSEVS
ncbi:MAG: addiction module antitoxin RelB [Verrucomicrobia bacterium]|nr:MAG: addiction module antitoxin RelB [Verrucomicrobiota bacterium]